ncbi:MAG: hypothetical protein KatS3mg104_0465 [Phycisphaerae bacterium]|jgi:hypothetical protein|nr:MAG: hypothetical protein KatS3mg104_0465 [Phycisphaerae bacterium]
MNLSSSQDPVVFSMLPQDATWAGVMVLIVLGWFLSALTIGLAVRVVMPERYETKKQKDSSRDPVSDQGVEK